ncbi:MAG: hypothetical protein LBT17_02890 [Mycoplasmataceae bacterium]|jgi:hypothetical protein|nr:hypothetical protein [Mycoplasmataceae bacterium]
MTNYIYEWVLEPEKNDIIEMLETAQPIYFQFQGQDYLLETYDRGILIAQPFLFYENGGFPDKKEFIYPQSFQAKNVKEFLELPFLDGKTLFDQWNNIRFWNY